MQLHNFNSVEEHDSVTCTYSKIVMIQQIFLYPSQMQVCWKIPLEYLNPALLFGPPGPSLSVHTIDNGPGEPKQYFFLKLPTEA